MESNVTVVQSTSRYTLAYLFWAISVAGTVALLLAARSSVMVVLGVTQWDRYLENALNQFGFLFLAIFGLGVIVFTEHFYRTGVEKNRLLARFLLITFLQLLLFTGMHLVRVVGVGIFTPTTFLSVGIELVLCLVLFWLYRWAIQRVSTRVAG